MDTEKKIAVIDFGGQYAHLIASRIRRIGAYSEILPNTVSAKELEHYAGIILSGGPESVYEPNSPKLDPNVFQLPVPILGICYGHQLMMKVLGGEVKPSKTKEFGKADLEILGNSAMSQNLSANEVVWMSHGDEVTKLPEGFSTWAKTHECKEAGVWNSQKKYFGIQFHPEVTHTKNGNVFLSNFLELTNAKSSWSIEDFYKMQITTIRSKVPQGRKVIFLVSGGVDSTVAYLLTAKALGKENVFGLLVDTGFMRKDEVSNLKQSLAKLDFNLEIYDASELFYNSLKGEKDPERKRKIVGDLFIEVQKKALEKLNLDPAHWILGQGTIYPDTIESGGTKHSHTIKTHHNRVPIIQKLIEEGKIIEPIADLYKDEVRELGKLLGLEKQWIARHPFPGPGLVVRMICGTKEVSQDSVKPIVDSFQKTNPELKLDFSILPIPSVGVQGDQRTYQNCLAIPQFTKDWSQIKRIATAAINQFSFVNRAVLAISQTQPPKQFYLRNLELDRKTSDILREVDAIVNSFLLEKDLVQEIWQMPVVITPVGTRENTYSIVLRPVESQEAMTADAYEMDWSLLEILVNRILEISEISSVWYDITSKPPGTIEWE